MTATPSCSFHPGSYGGGSGILGSCGTREGHAAGAVAGGGASARERDSEPGVRATSAKPPKAPAAGCRGRGPPPLQARSGRPHLVLVPLLAVKPLVPLPHLGAVCCVEGGAPGVVHLRSGGYFLAEGVWRVGRRGCARVAAAQRAHATGCACFGRRWAWQLHSAAAQRSTAQQHMHSTCTAAPLPLTQCALPSRWSAGGCTIVVLSGGSCSFLGTRFWRSRRWQAGRARGEAASQQHHMRRAAGGAGGLRPDKTAPLQTRSTLT